MTDADIHENAMQALMLGDGGCISCMVRKIIHRAGFFARDDARGGEE